MTDPTSASTRLKESFENVGVVRLQYDELLSKTSGIRSTVSTFSTTSINTMVTGITSVRQHNLSHIINKPYSSLVIVSVTETNVAEIFPNIYVGDEMNAFECNQSETEMPDEQTVERHSYDAGNNFMLMLEDFSEYFYSGQNLSTSLLSTSEELLNTSYEIQPHVNCTWLELFGDYVIKQPACADVGNSKYCVMCLNFIKK